MKIADIRDRFPVLCKKIYGKDLVYFDNAASSQRLDTVVEKQGYLSLNTNANIHRAVHYLASAATDEYESTRDAVKEFVNAGSREEIIFSSGTTAAINLVAYSFGEAFVHSGDEVIVSEAEHHSNIVPWQLMCARKGAGLRVLHIDDNGYINLLELNKLISKKTKILAIAHISNVLGLVNPVKETVELCHDKGVPVLVDGAQGIVHQTVDVQDLDCDFYAFSGHKIYAATGTGVLYGKRRWLDAMPPYMSGGEMVDSVKFAGTTFAPIPGKFEAGTQNINAIPTLKPAMEFQKNMALDEELNKETEAVKEFLIHSLRTYKGLRLYGVPYRTKDKAALFSFSVEGVHHEDLALILDKMGIAVRSGQMCAEPIMDKYRTTGMVRISLAPYNTMAEAEYFMESLDRAVRILTQ